MWTTVLGARAIQQDYAIDLNRLYLGGTGEGVLATVNAMLVGSEFAGIVQISGSINVANLPADILDTLKRKYLVFMTSTNDKANKTVRADYDSYKKAGFDNITLIYDLKGSRDVAKPELIDEAIRYLDSRLR
jgi:predicted peptidase